MLCFLFSIKNKRRNLRSKVRSSCFCGKMFIITSSWNEVTKWLPWTFPLLKHPVLESNSQCMRLYFNCHIPRSCLILILIGQKVWDKIAGLYDINLLVLIQFCAKVSLSPLPPWSFSCFLEFWWSIFSSDFLSMGCSKYEIFFITQSWATLLHDFVSNLLRELLDLHVACLVGLQTGRPFRTGVFILTSCDRPSDTLIAHKWTLIN